MSDMHGVGASLLLPPAFSSHVCRGALCTPRLVSLASLRANSRVMYWIAYSILQTDSFLQDEVQMYFYSVEYKSLICLLFSIMTEI